MWMKSEPFCLYHIIFLLIAFTGYILGGYFVYKKTNDKSFNLVLKISGGALLLAVTINVIFGTIFKVNHNFEGMKMYMMFPYSFCSFAGFVLSLAVLLGKKNNIVLHFVCFMAFMGGLISTIYPDYLSTFPAYHIVNITGLLHHSIDVWIVLIIFLKGYITPSFKKIPVFVVGYGIMMLVGVVEIYAFKFPDAMNIRNPILSDFPFLTSWYMLWVETSAACSLYILIYWLINKKKQHANAV